MNKKIITAILLFVLMLQVCGTSSIVQASDFIGGLGVEEKIYPQNVTRANFAKIIVRLFDLQFDENAEQSIFNDVKEDIGYINSITTAGMMGVGSEKFYPNHFIKTCDAVECLLTAAGYVYLDTPEDYIQEAIALGMLKNHKECDSPLTFEELNTMLEKYMDIEYFKPLFDKNFSYESAGSVGNNLLKITKIRGRVTGNAMGTLLGEEMRENVISIDNKNYIDYEMEYQHLIGYSVKAYIRHTDDGDELIYMYPERKNSELVLPAKNILQCEDYLLEYESSSKNVKKAQIDIRADVLYNGKALTRWTFDDFEITNGEICLLDSDSDGKYDFINITTYWNLWVGGVSKLEKKILNNFDGLYYDFSEDRNDIIVEYTQNGRKIDFDNIEKNAILNIYETRNTTGIKYYKIDMTVNFVEGIVNGIDADTIRINEQLYNYAYSMRSDVSLGTKGTFFMDCENTVVAYSQDYVSAIASSNNYAFFYKLTQDDDAEDVYLFFVDLEGKKKKFKCREKITIRNGTNKINLKAIDLINRPELYDGFNYIPQMLIYDLNTSGEIATLYLATQPEMGRNYDRNPDAFSLDIIMRDYGDLSKSYYMRNTRKLTNGSSDYEASCMITSKTKIITLPRGILKGQDVDEDDVEILQYIGHESYRDQGYSAISGEAKYLCSDGLVYDCDELNIASIVVVFHDDTRNYTKNSIWTYMTDHAIVRDVHIEVNEDDEIEYNLDVTFSSVGERTVRLKGQAIDDLKDVASGDIIRFHGDLVNSGEITDGHIVFSRKAKDSPNGGGNRVLTPNSYGKHPDCDVFVARVDGVSSEVVMLSGVKQTPETYLLHQWTNIWIMDMRTKQVTVTKGIWDDIPKGATVYANIRDEEIRDIVVIID